MGLCGLVAWRDASPPVPFVHISDEVEMGRVKGYLVLGVEPRQAELRGICGERTQREQVFFCFNWEWRGEVLSSQQHKSWQRHWYTGFSVLFVPGPFSSASLLFLMLSYDSVCFVLFLNYLFCLGCFSFVFVSWWGSGRKILLVFLWSMERI